MIRLNTEFEIVDITPSNVNEYDLLCVKSKKQSDGYQNKLHWFDERYKEGLRFKLLMVKEKKGMTSRGFIEYIPGNFSWRVVNAPNYNVIHCLWVVGKWKKLGFGRQLIETVVEDSKVQEKDGVVCVTSEGNWLVDKKIFEKNGFAAIDQAPPSFNLMVLKLKEVDDPTFPKDWEKRAMKFGDGLTVLHTDQCPYQLSALKAVKNFAENEKIPFRSIRFDNSKDIQKKFPTAYGVYAVVYNGKILTYCYQKESQLAKLIDAIE